MAENPEKSIESLLHALTVVPEVRWYHLADPASPALDELAAHFGIHPLQVEDCRHRRQTAHVEEHERYTFVVVKVLSTPQLGQARSLRGTCLPPLPQTIFVTVRVVTWT
jgi:Mg2+ and Co2+ transporter CorA